MATLRVAAHSRVGEQVSMEIGHIQFSIVPNQMFGGHACQTRTNCRARGSSHSRADEQQKAGSGLLGLASLPPSTPFSWLFKSSSSRRIPFLHLSFRFSQRLSASAGDELDVDLPIGSALLCVLCGFARDALSFSLSFLDNSFHVRQDFSQRD